MKVRRNRKLRKEPLGKIALKRKQIIFAKRKLRKKTHTKKGRGFRSGKENYLELISHDKSKSWLKPAWEQERGYRRRKEPQAEEGGGMGKGGKRVP